MIRYECDGCGRHLGANDPRRFVVRMEVFAAAGPIELPDAQTAGDPADRMREVMAELEAIGPDAAEDQTYRCLRFDLCDACRRRVLRDPLGRGANGEARRTSG